MREFFLFPLLLLLLSTKCGGVGNALDSSDGDVVASTPSELQEAVARLQDTQTVRLTSRLFRLTHALVLGASNVTLDGGPESATLVCPSGASALSITGNNVAVRRLKFQDCDKHPAVVVETTSNEKRGGSIVFQDSVFVGNHNPGQGAGVQLRPGAADGVQTALFERCTFGRNLARVGAAIHAEGYNVMIVDSEFQNNTAKSERGGAIQAVGSKLSIQTTRFFKNTALLGGGAVSITDPGSHLDVRNCVFEENSCQSPDTADRPALEIEFEAIGTGGAISTHNVEGFTVRSTTFLDNRAVFGGAIDATREADMGEAQHIWNPIDNCTFRGNEAHLLENVGGSGSGGAISLRASASFLFVNLSSSDFLDNVGFRGGALALGTLATQMRVRVTSQDITFSGNRGVVGGAVCLFGGVGLTISAALFEVNNGRFGGAVASFDGAEFDVPKHSSMITFASNTAASGGAIMCQSCGHLQIDAPVVFSENVARDSGGALYVFNFQGNLKLPRSEFTGNVAAVGGALNIHDQYISYIGDKSRQTRFTNNSALTGGALYIESQHALTTDFKLKNALFEYNQAIEFNSEVQETDSPALRRWRQEWQAALADEESQHLECPECFHGRGGALYLSLGKIRDRATVLLHLVDVTILHNSALIGGGGYIETSRKKWHREIGYWKCRRSVFSERMQRCYGIGYHNVIVANNTAKLAAGGLFLRYPKSLSFLNQTFALQESAVNREESDSDNAVLVMHNTIEDHVHGYGPQIATNVVSLKLKNVYGPLTNFTTGERLVVKQGGMNGNASNSNEGILIEVKDLLNQTISCGTKDAGIVVFLNSSWISGQRRYVAQNGVINISETTIVGVDVRDEIEIFVDKREDISVSVKFSTLPCSDGDLADASRSSCFRCKHGSYTFGTRDACRSCEDNAVCPGTTALVPKSGYWHSSPFSPKIRRCLVKKACSSENRTFTLLQFYNDSAAILQQLTEFRENPVTYKSKDYQQCAVGHTGILCGTCSPDYGHLGNGMCHKCTRTLALSRLITVFVTLMLFLVVSFRLFLEVDGVKKDVAFELAQQKRAARSILEEYSVARSQSLQSWNASNGEHMNGNSTNAVTESLTARPSKGPAAETSTQPNPPDHRTPLLLRSVPIEDPLASGELEEESEHEMPSPEVREASGNLSETYKILFNYVQLNSVALSLDVGWRGALKSVLSVQSSVGRITSGMEFMPFDCNFSDRSRDEGIPNSINALLYQTTFPLLTIGVYMFLIRINGYLQGETVTSRYTVSFLPPLRLVFLVVYLSYCIDIFSNLLKVFNCFSVEPVDHDHGYAQYEILQNRPLWAEDTSVTCWEGAHFWTAILAALGLAFCFGVICFTIVILYQGKRQMKLATPEFLLRYGFLYLGFRTDGLALYWESVITIRRMLMAAVSVYARSRETTNAQIGFAAMVIYTYIALHMIVQPYDDQDSSTTFPSYAGASLRYVGAYDLSRQWVAFNQYLTLNSLEGASLFMSLSLFMTAMGINDRESVATEANVLLVVCCALNCIFFLFMLYRLWSSVHRSLDVTAKEKGISFQGKTGNADCDTWLLYKVWVIMTTTFVHENANTSIDAV